MSRHKIIFLEQATEKDETGNSSNKLNNIGTAVISIWTEQTIMDDINTEDVSRETLRFPIHDKKIKSNIFTMEGKIYLIQSKTKRNKLQVVVDAEQDPEQYYDIEELDV